NDGWTLSSNTCNVNACSGYALSSCPEHGNCGTCKSGTSDKYALNSCQDGYTKSGSACNPNSCTGYTLSSCPTGGNCSNCKSGANYKYTLNSCQSGYTKSGSTSCIKCNAGYIYYSDNTCSSTYYSTKTVVGVVGGNGFIVYYQHQGCRTWTSAKSTCSGITKGGKTARLPTKDEAEQMRDNYSSIVTALRKISGASDNLSGNTWTSTETASDKVWYVNIEEKQTGIDYKAKDCDNTRCVFSF
ncbi:MAG: hypothetical protein IJ545_05720, partial [Alphaproteobacteria bacterium]|nr:hypothetical protein [Alphaproteobacteria bacterium]